MHTNIVLSEKGCISLLLSNQINLKNHVRVFLPQHQTCRFSNDFVSYIITFSNKSLCICDVKIFNLHIKQTEISEKRSKEMKNCKGCYFVIL